MSLNEDHRAPLRAAFSAALEATITAENRMRELWRHYDGLNIPTEATLLKLKAMLDKLGENRKTMLEMLVAIEQIK
jgi:hypothetical protein